MKKEITKEQLEELYIKQNLSTREIAKLLKCSKTRIIKNLSKYNIRKEKDIVLQEAHTKRKQTNLEKYGREEFFNDKQVQQKISQTLECKYGGRGSAVPKIKAKVCATLIEHYGTDKLWEVEEIHNRQVENIRAAYATGIPQEKIKDKFATGIPTTKQMNTKIQNNTCNFSGPAKLIKELLINKLGKEDIITEYQDSRYSDPSNNRCFSCDFYIKSLDLFIEFQGAHYHYKEPYDKNNPEHIKRLRKLYEQPHEKGYQAYHMIRVWTQSDPLKRKIAKENNLNFKELWSLQEAREFINSL